MRSHPYRISKAGLLSDVVHRRSLGFGDNQGWGQWCGQMDVAEFRAAMLSLGDELSAHVRANLPESHLLQPEKRISLRATLRNIVRIKT